jgi:predicted membrane protein DUF2232
MMQIVLIGLGAGAAAALLFASVASGVVLSILLFYLAPLPIMIAALGWSHWAGLVAAVTAAAALGLAFGGVFFIAFLAGVAMPAWWLGYLALLGRPGAHGGALEWYPPGRLVLWTAALGALVIGAALASYGTDAQTIRTSLRAMLETVFRLQTGLAAGQPLRFPGIEDPDRLLDIFAVALPPMAALIAAMTEIVNLWLAGHIVKLSGRLRRPWPDLAEMAFPRLAAGAFAAAVAGSLIPDLPGLIAGLFAATLALAFMILGFAFLHAATRGVAGRGVMLAGAYGLVAVLVWPALVVTALGVVDALFHWRARFGKRGPPPPPPYPPPHAGREGG